MNAPRVRRAARISPEPPGPSVRSRSLITRARALLLVCFVALGFNFSSVTLSPSVWTDETLFADPAINLVGGQGFRSSAWPQPKDQMFAGNCPLYSLLLAGWLKCLGIGIVQVRSLNYVLVCVAVVLVCVACWRFGLVNGAGNTALLATLLLGGWMMAFSYRGARYDMLGLALVAGMFLACAHPRKAIRLSIFTVLAALLPIAGLQNAPAYAAIALVVWIATGGRWLIELTAGAIGIVLGGAALVGWYAHYGVLSGFLQMVGTVSEPMSRRLALLHVALISDLSMLWVILIAIALLILQRRQSTAKKYFIVALLFAVIVPVVMQLFARFQPYYCWMKYVPAVICVSAGLERSSTLSNGTRRLIICLLGVAALPLPARIIDSILRAEEKNYDRIDAYLAGQIHPDDVVLTTPEGYYPAKRIAKLTYGYAYIETMNLDERREVTMMIVKPENDALMREQVGGAWALVATPDPHWESVYRLFVYRRLKMDR